MDIDQTNRNLLYGPFNVRILSANYSLTDTQCSIFMGYRLYQKSLKITENVNFYCDAIPKNAGKLDIPCNDQK